MEIQVRSGEMHKVAEFGLASHWDYKARSKKSKFANAGPGTPNAEPLTDNEHHFGMDNSQSSDAYLRRLQEWHWTQKSGPLHDFSDPISSEASFFSEQAESEIRADRIRARTQRLAPYIEALTAAQSDLVREQVFVFLHQPEAMAATEGHVMALPSGAVILDALRELEKNDVIPSYMSEGLVAHNGAPAMLTSRLQNGDILSIPTATPTPVSA